MISLLILAVLAVAAWLYAKAYQFSNLYCEVLLTIHDYESIVNYSLHSPALALARKYTIGCACWLALASTILLQAVVA